ncbi:nucleotidyltransferase family protein [Prosthecochloris sp. SCSIO W1103]|uniref:nucleotidyltransferase family protein n=1 Tax=Prosthecochloris sp. SCSIO W1103 TaxID=2992244 RepID=UPI00223DF28C|nr:nucleotidyltransferase domain-containing protein [Prosthecochloris sp. SCSIO W1103]UZJ38163.1 nucleotidyltransferase domain-containing protein [Prosthecochloris sp. SCSIO W1103]
MQRKEVLQILSENKKDLTERYGLKKMGIFGSVAKNIATSDSDIDIVVEMAPDILLRAELKQELERILGNKVDLIRYWKRMNHYLKQHIDKEALYV